MYKLINSEENLPNDVCDNCAKPRYVDGENEHEGKDHEESEQVIRENRTRGHRYCSEHKTKKLRSFCEPCEKPVCTKCITDSHNGHAVQKLSTVCKDIKKVSQRKKEEIEENILPRYRELLETESKRKAAFSRQAEEIKNDIKTYTENVVKMVKQMGENTLKDLKVQKKEGLKGIKYSKVEIERKIERLQQIKEMLSGNMEATPNSPFFKPVNSNLLDEFQTLPVLAKYQLSNFKPGKIDEKIKNSFGRSPMLEIDNGEVNDCQNTTMRGYSLRVFCEIKLLDHIYFFYKKFKINIECIIIPST